MRTYETIVIIGADTPEPQVKDLVKKLEDILAAKGASNLKTERLGVKTLAYRLKKKSSAHYVNFKYEAENGNATEQITKALSIEDGIIKFETHRSGLPTRKFQGRIFKNAKPGANNTVGLDIDSN